MKIFHHNKFCRLFLSLFLTWSEGRVAGELEPGGKPALTSEVLGVVLEAVVVTWLQCGLEIFSKLIQNISKYSVRCPPVPDCGADWRCRCGWSLQSPAWPEGKYFIITIQTKYFCRLFLSLFLTCCCPSSTGGSGCL